MPSQEFPVSLGRRPEVVGEPGAPEAGYSVQMVYLNRNTSK